MSSHLCCGVHDPKSDQRRCPGTVIVKWPKSWPLQRLALQWVWGISAGFPPKRGSGLHVGLFCPEQQQPEEVVSSATLFISLAVVYEFWSHSSAHHCLSGPKHDDGHTLNLVMSFGLSFFFLSLPLVASVHWDFFGTYTFSQLCEGPVTAISNFNQTELWQGHLKSLILLFFSDADVLLCLDHFLSQDQSQPISICQTDSFICRIFCYTEEFMVLKLLNNLRSWPFHHRVEQQVWGLSASSGFTFNLICPENVVLEILCFVHVLFRQKKLSSGRSSQQTNQVQFYFSCVDMSRSGTHYNCNFIPGVQP